MKQVAFNPGPETAFPLIIASVLLTFISITVSLGIFVSFTAAIACVIGTYVSVPFLFAGIPLLQRTLIFMNKVKWINRKDHFNPKSHDMEGGRNFYINSDKGIEIGVWHLLPSSIVKSSVGKPTTFWTDSLKTNNNPVIIYLHGNMGTRTSGHRTELYQVLQDANFHVVAIDYRGYADSTSVPTLTETALVRDALATYEWVIANVGNSVPIYIWGHSLGTGVATHVGALISKEDKRKRLAGVILESPFTNMKELAMNTGLTKIYKYFPGATQLFTSSFPRIDTEFKSDEHIVHIDAPILILHTENDAVVPIELGKKLYEVKQKWDEENGSKNFIHLQVFPEFHFWAPHAFICRVPSLPVIIRKFTENPQLL